MNCMRASLLLKRGSLSRGFAPSMLVMALGAGASSWGSLSALAQAPGQHTAKAIAARTVSVHETMRTDEVINHQGNAVINERGRGTGTYTCPTLMRITTSYTNGSVGMSCSTSSGEVKASGKVSFFTAGPTATFTGTMTVERGTGKYTHASGRLHVEGSMVRKTFALSATMSGLMTY